MRQVASADGLHVKAAIILCCTREIQAKDPNDRGHGASVLIPPPANGGQLAGGGISTEASALTLRPQKMGTFA